MISKEILIVDDDDYIRELLTDFLSMEGFVCQTVSTVDQAVEALNTATNPYGLILLDRHIENSLGEDFLARIRSKSLKTPVILLTGDHDIGRKEAQDMGAQDVIHKPLDVGHLMTCIRSSMVLP